jgi:hypothetical protein
MIGFQEIQATIGNGFDMITMQDFIDYRKKEEELKAFLIQKCREVDDAHGYEYNKYMEEDFTEWEINEYGTEIDVYFYEYRTYGGDGNGYRFTFEPETDFNDAFYTDLLVKYADERERRIAEREMKVLERMSELKKQQKEIERSEIKRLRELVYKYRDVAKTIIEEE